MSVQSLPDKVNRQETVRNGFAYVFRHRTTKQFYVLGKGWHDQADGQTFSSEQELFQYTQQTIKRAAFIELLQNAYVMQLRVTSYVNDQKTPSKSLIEKLKLDELMEGIYRLKLPFGVASYYESFHRRPNKANYHYAMALNEKKLNEWAKVNWDSIKNVVPSYITTSSFAYYGEEGIKILTKDIGLKYPQTRTINHLVLFRNKADATLFKLTYGIPGAFFDFPEIYKDFEATGKLTLKAS